MFVEQPLNGTWFTRLYLDNQNADPPKPFVLTERNPRTVREEGTEHNFASYGFDELMLQRKVRNYVHTLLDRKLSYSYKIDHLHRPPWLRSNNGNICMHLCTLHNSQPMVRLLRLQQGQCIGL